MPKTSKLRSNSQRRNKKFRTKTERNSAKSKPKRSYTSESFSEKRLLIKNKKLMTLKSWKRIAAKLRNRPNKSSMHLIKPE